MKEGAKASQPRWAATVLLGLLVLGTAGSRDAAAGVPTPPAPALPHPLADPAVQPEPSGGPRAPGVLLNNFGLYQVGRDRSGTYLHPGLDFMAPNGTRVFAVAPGRVTHVGGSRYNEVVVVEDEADPSRSWAYVHVNNIQVSIGKRVRAGDHLADIYFLPGSDHLHLDRLVRSTSSSGEVVMQHENPLPYFRFVDNEAPLLEEPFHYFRNETDDAISRTGDVMQVSGDVDIVVGARDPAPFARNQTAAGGGLGDRLAPLRFEYEVRRVGGRLGVSVPSFDFGRLRVAPPDHESSTSAEVALTIFKYFPVLRPDEHWAQRKYSYYIVTNAPPAGATAISPADGNRAWRTGERDARGRRRFPNGDYLVTVRAWDAAGNMIERTERVRVRNQ